MIALPHLLRAAGVSTCEGESEGADIVELDEREERTSERGKWKKGRVEGARSGGERGGRGEGRVYRVISWVCSEVFRSNILAGEEFCGIVLGHTILYGMISHGRHV